MPKPIAGQDPSVALRTIYQSAVDHQRGTIFVGDSQVSHRSALGRLFKANPVRHKQSIDQFKLLLQQAHPGEAKAIDQLLTASYAKGRLTTGAVKRAYAFLNEPAQHKFRIDYPQAALTDAQKLDFEDRKALAVLQDPKTIRTVCDYAQRLADRMESSEAFTDLHAELFLESHQDGAKEYPVFVGAKDIPRTKAGLISYLRETAAGSHSDKQVLLLSMMWGLPKQVAEAEKLEEVRLIDRLYAQKVKAGKQHEATHDAGAVTKPGTFGNTELPSPLMDRLMPHQKEREAVRVLPEPNPRIAKFLAQGKPYISGYSGMANCGSTVFPLLGDDMRSPEAKRYGEALAAFIVGSGEHSYPEVYKSLNLSLRHLQLGRDF